MADEKKRCENCWVMVKAGSDACPNCSHPFPMEEPAGERKAEKPVASVPVSKPAIDRPFKFLVFFLLSFVAVEAFIIMEGIGLKGRLDSYYVYDDLFWVTVVSMLMAAVFVFIDYMLSD